MVQVTILQKCFYSTARVISVASASGGVVRVVMTQVMIS